MRRIFYTLFFLLALISHISGQQTCDAPKITDIQGNENPFINCDYPLNGRCLVLKTTVPEFYDTSSYEVNSTAFSPYGDFNSGIALNANADDLYIKKILLPFNFCFFGMNFSEVVVGTNGKLSFDSKQLGNVDYPNIQATNPSPELFGNTIFGAAQDLVFSDNNDSEIYYSITGTAPCRKLIVNYYKAGIVGCEQTSTFQIVLNESTNIIEIFVDEKPLSCAGAKFKNSLLGIVNADGSLGYSPPSRNTGVWGAEKESWKFTPTGAAIVPVINWYDEDNKNIGTGESISVCPENNEIYKVKLNYPVCGNLNLVLEDTAEVTFAPDYPLSKDFTKIYCGSASVNVDLNAFLSDLTPQNPANLKFTFHDTLADAENNVNPLLESLLLTTDRQIFVRVQNPNDPLCFRTSVLNLSLMSKSLLTSKVEVCDINNDGIEKNFTLSLLTDQLFAMPLSGKIHYFKSQNDAENNLNEITTADITDNLQLFVTYKTAECSQVFGPVTLKFLPSPEINSPVDFTFTSCDFKNDKVEKFDFLSNIGPLITTDPNVSIQFYNSLDEAYSGVGSQIYTVREGKYKVYARVGIPGGCFSIATINLDIIFTKVEAINKTEYICFDGIQDVSVDLDTYSGSMLVNPLTGITITYFLRELDAENELNPISNMQTIIEDGDFVTKNFYVRFTDATGCYALKVLSVNLVHVVIAKSNFEICDFLNNGTENVNLSTFSSAIVGTQNAKVVYFATADDAQNSKNPLSTFQLNNAAKLYVKITSFGCSNIFEINLKLFQTPVVKTEVDAVRNSVCDNNNDGQEKFDLTQLESEIYSGAAPVNFKYYTGYDAASNSFSGLITAPQSFLVKGTVTVFAKVTYTGGCFSAAKINIKLNFLPGIILQNASLQKCDYDFDLNESFTLKDALPKLFDQTANSILFGDLAVSYYDTETDANAGISSTQITSPFVTINSEKNVWVRFSSNITSCYSVSKLTLETYLPPKALNSSIPDICDDNLDGKYEVNLNNFTSGMVYQIKASNKFSFFTTLANATANQNPILNPEKFSVDPFPSRIYVRVENIPGCFDVATIDLKLGKKVVLSNAGPFTITDACDIGNDGAENVNLTQFEKQIFSGVATFEYFTSISDLNNNINKISTPLQFLYNVSSGPQKIFAKVTTAGFCPEMVVINPALKETPMFTLPDYFFCPGVYVNIQPDFDGLNIVKFEWLNPSGEIISSTAEILKVKLEGTYKINVTAKNGCTFSTEFKVKMYEVPIITELVANGNSFTVVATGSRAILYSIDGISYQTGNVFNDLPVGVTTFYVKFVDSDCLGEIKRGLILDIKNAFTPTGDGINDTWYIDDINVFEGKNANLKVYDRSQKLVFEQESAEKLEWNGKTGKRGVPTGTYWYILTLPDGRTFNGWVLLKNRN